MLSRARAVLLVLAGLTLAACGTIHPGDAAVVDGQAISMETLDRTAKVYCTLTLRSAQEQGATAPDNADLRRQAVTSLVSLVVARKLADDNGVSPKPSTYEITTVQESQIAKAFPQGDLGAIKQAIEESQELSEIAVALGADSTGETRTADNEAQLAEAGQAEITQAFGVNDVKFSPRFGFTSSAKAAPGTGSLSVSSVELDDADAKQLPAAQRCS